MSLVEKVNWEKNSGLIPAIAQDKYTGAVLMLGYMNREALVATLENQVVIFYSRSKQRLWMKGETSGNRLLLKSICLDCDQDTLLMQVEAVGPTCHTGDLSCFGDVQKPKLQILNDLEQLIESRINQLPENSYTADLVRSGIQRLAQKVGEEAVEVVVATLAQDNTAVINESADLLYHLMVLLKVLKLGLEELLDCLTARSTTQVNTK